MELCGLCLPVWLASWLCAFLGGWVSADLSMPWEPYSDALVIVVRVGDPRGPTSLKSSPGLWEPVLSPGERRRGGWQLPYPGPCDGWGLCHARVVVDGGWWGMGRMRGWVVRTGVSGQVGGWRFGAPSKRGSPCFECALGPWGSLGVSGVFGDAGRLWGLK
jgi:hypothetical protein